MKFLGFLLLCVIVLCGLAAWYIYVPFGPQTEAFVDIAPGTGTAEIGRVLQQNGILRSQYAFDALRLKLGGRLKAGEYRFDHPATAIEVYNRIARGDVYTVAITVPEGFNLWEIGGAIEHAGLAKQADFVAAAKKNTALIADWNPHAASLEGYLFPDTYKFDRHTTVDTMQATMVRRFTHAMSQLGVTPTGDVPRLIIMASLIEKEVAVNSERPMVAGVFENRLRTGMPLATDPTVIYAAMRDGRWRGTIYASDLAYDSPYNTYKHAGLPPGPICSPGMAALRAALHPAQTDAMYFVADAAGHTNFSATLQEHDQQVQAYRNATR